MSSDNEVTGKASEVTIEKMVYGGEGLSRTSEGVLLVPGVVTGERARVLPEPARRGVRRGRLVDLLESSADRIPPDCPHYARCGGCQYQHVAYLAQLEMKRQILAECFERIGRFHLEVPIQVIPSEPWRYRNRVRLQIEKDPSGFCVGYLEHASHHLVPVDSCPIAMPAIEAVLRALSKEALANLFPEGTAELELFTNESGSALLATVYSPLPAPQGFGDGWRSALPQFESVCWSQTAPRARGPHSGDTVWGTGALTYRVGEFHYRVSHHSFFQANRVMLQPMMEAAMGSHSGARALDLYAGVGFFTLLLARRFERVAAVESHPASARDLAANAGVMGTHVHVHHKTVEQFLAATSRNWDLVLADPPRTGLGRAVSEGLRRLRAPRLVYVSCDPTTLARDLAALCDSAYRIESVHLADQFPQTFHIETIVHLTRAS
ncbi:MAG: 23S rRNA (uracil(1939)-C(5))-methyltransferase RlmD [Acidobacteria bacterium]|nr:23S rRNA (uracil(1939)-C(5))-methyltransferase RlmD [Acidobacteriota bacterium]